jgi:hypothetical protein
MNTLRRASFSQSAAWKTSAASTLGVRSRRTLEKTHRQCAPGGSLEEFTTIGEWNG